MNNTKKSLLLLTLLIFFIFQSLLHLTKPMYALRDGMGDSYVRIVQAVTNKIPEYGVWQPLYYYFLKFSIANLGVYFGPRIMGIFIFLLLSIVLYIFTKRLFNSRASIWTTLFFITSGYFTDYLTFPVTEVLFSLFLLSALYLLFFYKNYSQLFFSVLFFSLANAIRFESWILLPIVVIYLYLKTKNMKVIFFYTFLYILYPLYYLCLNFLKTGNPLYFIADYKIQTVFEKIDFYIPFFILIKKFIINFNPILLLVLCFSFINKDFRKIISPNKKFILFICGAILITLLLLRTAITPTRWFPDEYLFFPILIIYPFLGYAAHYLSKRYSFIPVLFLIITIISLENNFYIKT